MSRILTMPTSTVHPENYTATAVQEGAHEERIQQHRNTNCRPTKRQIRFLIFGIAVLVVVICAIVIPVVLTANPKKTVHLVTTTSITSSPNSLETNTMHTSATAGELAKTTGSSMTSANTTDITHYVNSDIVQITDVDPSTSGDSVSHKWITTMTTATISDGHTMDKTAATTSATTTTTRRYIRLNQFDDTIQALINTIAGGNSGGPPSIYSGAKAENAMDDSFKTKYYNPGGTGVYGPGVNTGFVVIPSARKPTVACALLFATGNDDHNRDPLTVTLEGSNEVNIDQLKSGSSWNPIYNGPTGIDAMSILPRQKYAPQQDFPNEKAFISYRLLVTSKRNASSGVQYSEAHIFGCS